MTGSNPLNTDLARSCWHLVAHRSEVANDRDYLRLSWPLGELVVSNDGGNVVAFDNICPHRGTRIFQKDHGSSAIACPYHGWAFRNGQLKIPNATAYPQADIDVARFNFFETEWCGDFLFASVAPDQTLESQLSGLDQDLAPISRSIGYRHDFNRSAWACDWRVAVENALEPDHVNFIHPGSLGTLSLSIGESHYSGKNSTLRAEITNSRTAGLLVSLERLFALQYQHKGYLSIFLYPFTFITSSFGYSYSLQHFLPAETPAVTNFSSRLLVAKHASDAATKATAAFYDSTSKMNRQVFDEDRLICERISPAYDLDKPDRIFSATEEKARHFHRSLSEQRHRRASTRIDALSQI